VQTQNQKGRNAKGFTLIEVMIAIVILSVGLLGMASLTIGIIKGNKVSNDLTMATTCAQDKLENFQRLDYADIPPTTSPETEDYNSVTGYENYKRVTLTTADSPAENMKTVTVTVFWRDAHLGEHSVELSTIFSQ
jgi:type IV pilus assembly protein PilV